jgi:hypothetical protein
VAVRHKKRELTKRQWINYAAKPKIVQAIESDTYRFVYGPLIEHFATLRARTPTWEEALAAVHVVYAWMPTILKPDRAGALFSSREALVGAIQRAQQKSALASKIPDSDLELVFTFANQSYVGASKLLHFLNPEKFPIWDRRVANAFLWRDIASSTINKANRLMRYYTVMESWSCDGCVLEHVETLRRRIGYLQGASTIRIIELVMFHAGA